MFTNINLTDMECCYKAFKSSIIKNIDLKENRFGFEPEVTAKIAKKTFVFMKLELNILDENIQMERKLLGKMGSVPFIA